MGAPSGPCFPPISQHGMLPVDPANLLRALEQSLLWVDWQSKASRLPRPPLCPQQGGLHTCRSCSSSCSPPRPGPGPRARHTRAGHRPCWGQPHRATPAQAARRCPQPPRPDPVLQGFSDAAVHRTPLGSPESAGLGLCISKQLPGGAGAAGPQNTPARCDQGSPSKYQKTTCLESHS